MNVEFEAQAAPAGGAGERTTDPWWLRYQADRGIIAAGVVGFWSASDADDYFDNLAALIGERRRKGGAVRVLIDRRLAPVQSPAVAERMLRANRELFRPADRLAILVDSQLVAMQVRRLFTHEGSGAFLLEEQAMAWLQVHRR